MPLETLKKLDAFVKGGGFVVATRRKPGIAPGFKVTEVEQAEFTRIVDGLFGGANPGVKFVEKDEEIGAAIKSLLKPDAEIGPSAKDFGFVHRKTADSDIYFVANTSNVKKRVQVAFRAKGARIEIWNAMNGQASAPNIHSQTADSTVISMDFEPYQSHTVVFLKQGTPMAKPGVPTPGSSLDLSADWKVTFGKGAPAEVKQLKSWADEEANRYYSGVATYERSFDVPANFTKAGGSAVLDFGEGVSLDVQPMRTGMRAWFDAPIREAAVIYVNEQRAGSLWSPPYKMDIARFLKPGRNDLKILVGNTALNYMAGRKLPDYKLLNLRYGERFQAQDMDKLPSTAFGADWNGRLVSIF